MSKEKATSLFKSIELAHEGDFDADCEQLWDFYRGAHKKHMGPILAAAYKNAVRSGMRTVAVPLVKRIVDTTATLFHRPPIWHISRDGEDLEEGTPERETWAAIDKAIRLNNQCKTGQRGSRRDKTAALAGAWRGKGDGKIHLDVYRPNQFFAVTDTLGPGDVDSIQAIALVSGQGYFMWADDVYGYFVKEDEDSEEYTCFDPLETGNVNPYGRIPVTIVHDIPGPDVIAALDDTLVTGQIAADTLWSAFTWAMQQGFTMNVMLTDADMAGKDLVGGPDRFIIAPSNGGDTVVKRLSSELDAEGMIHFVSALVKTNAVMHAADPGLFSLDTNSFADAISGVAKEVDRMDLVSVREDQEPDWEYYCADIFDSVRAVWNYHAPTAVQLGDDLELRMEWVEPRPAGNSLQDAQADALRVEAGTATTEEIQAERDGKALEDV